MTHFESPAHHTVTDFKTGSFVDGQVIAQFEIGAFQNFIYFILDWTTKQAMIVDTQMPLQAPLKQLQDLGFKVIGLLLTHSHHDHTNGIEVIFQQFPACLLYVHAKETFRIKHALQKIPPLQVKPVSENARILCGKIPIRVLHTPGHSAGACCFLIEEHPPILLTGDTIFIGTCGRTDLETGSIEQMFTSIQTLKQLDGQTIIFPGHHYSSSCSSTLEQEMETSPAFLSQTVEELKHS